jgi:hypothetical protein
MRESNSEAESRDGSLESRLAMRGRPRCGDAGLFPLAEHSRHT